MLQIDIKMWTFGLDLVCCSKLRLLMFKISCMNLNRNISDNS